MKKFVIMPLGLLLICFSSSLTLVSCKAKLAIANASVDAKSNVATRLTINKIIEKHYNNKTQFSTLYIKADARYANCGWCSS